MKYSINIAAIIVAITVLAHISFFKLNLGNTYYIVLAVPFLVLLLFGKEWKLNFFMVWLIFAGLISIYFNDIQSFFKPYERFIAFLLVMGLTGPLFVNNTLQYFRQILFKYFNALLVVFVILSFSGITVGFSSMLGRGGFAGLFNHSMMLGPMAAIAMLVNINWAYNTPARKKYWLYLILATMTFLTCVASGSRSALLAGIAGGLFYYYKINQVRLTNFIRTIIVIVSIAIFSFPYWESYTERFEQKMTVGENQNDVFYSRKNSWETRIKEFKSSPFIGVGFASVETSKKSIFDKTEGRVETGSSWLGLLSMIGLIGFFPLLLITTEYLKFVFKDKNNPTNSAFLGGLLVFFIVHMMAEGYMLSAGSGLFFYFWLLLGMLEIYSKTNHYKTSNSKPFSITNT